MLSEYDVVEEANEETFPVCVQIFAGLIAPGITVALNYILEDDDRKFTRIDYVFC